MAKVSVANEFAGILLANEKTEQKRQQRVSTAKRKDFTDILQDSVVHSSGGLNSEIVIDDNMIEKAMDEVFVLSERLKHDYALSYLEDYKSAVKNFLDIIRKRAYQHDRVKGRINRHSMMQKEYNLVRIVDEKLDRLAKAVLAEQRDMIVILSKIDEIRGLIINYVW